ncbi:hypothetical protein F4778DRAFT_529305 [Xylariomycetidae sp. FL2044]|nr:hypothetical protein F4778DRAFT_529305 [Xylariomycetidae sp. FL2044]
MDPLSAIGLVGNIITFLDFSHKVASTVKALYASSSGNTAHNEDLGSLALQLQSVSSNVHKAIPLGASSDGELALLKVVAECDSISSDLLNLLGEIKAKKPNSKRESLRAVFRDWRSKDRKDELEVKMQSCRELLNLQIAILARSESLERLDKLVASGKATGDDMRSLASNVESLRSGSRVSILSPEALSQIQSILKVSDEAILSVRYARVLDGLRFELMNDRFEDVESPHIKTFNWIFDQDSAQVSPASSRSSSIIPDIEEASQKKTKRDNPEVEQLPNLTESVDDVDTDSSFSSSWSSSPSPLSRPVAECALSADLNESKDPKEDSDCVWELVRGEDDGSIVSWSSEQSVPSSEQSVSKQIPARARASFVPKDQELPEYQVYPRSQARKSLVEWLTKGHGIYHIAGKPGCGKSTLMKYLSLHSKTKEYAGIWARDMRAVVGRFFFWKPGSALQKSHKGLIRGLLHSLLSACPDLISRIFPAQWESSALRDSIHIEHEDVQDAFDRLVANREIYDGHKFVFFIDGLDEFQGSHMDLIRKLFQWTENTESVKICVSSREWPIFQESFRECPQLRLHDLTKSDIHRFVRDRLAQMNQSILAERYHSYRSNSDALEFWIVENSDGVFLWVTLVTRNAEEGLLNGDSMGDLCAMIHSLPTELEPMLKELLQSIPERNKKLAYGMLSFACFLKSNKSALRLMRISFIEEYLRDKDFALHSSISLLSRAENSERLMKAER